MLKSHKACTLLMMSLLASCASIPSGPSVMALPGSGKTFDHFREDDMYCKQYASEQIGGTTPNRAAISTGVGAAAIGTGIGAAAGGAVAGGTGAIIGAGSGLLLGGLVGTGVGRSTGTTGQKRYDMGYVQCMYGKGHRVPISGQILDNSRHQPAVAPSQPVSGYSIPPPPPGNPPPPPPGNPPPPPPGNPPPPPPPPQ